MGRGQRGDGGEGNTRYENYSSLNACGFYDDVYEPVQQACTYVEK